MTKYAHKISTMFSSFSQTSKTSKNMQRTHYTIFLMNYLCLQFHLKLFNSISFIPSIRQNSDEDLEFLNHKKMKQIFCMPVNKFISVGKHAIKEIIFLLGTMYIHFKSLFHNNKIIFFYYGGSNILFIQVLTFQRISSIILCGDRWNDE